MESLVKLRHHTQLKKALLQRLQCTLKRDHIATLADGTEFRVQKGELLSGWVAGGVVQQRAGTPGEVAPGHFPRYYRLVFHFLRDGESWTYVGEVTQRLLRPRPEDELRAELAGDWPLDTKLFEPLDNLDPWPRGVKGREEIPAHITGCSYGVKLEDSFYWVELQVGYRSVYYRRSIEDLLFLRACRYPAPKASADTNWEEHAESYVHLWRTPSDFLGHVLATNDLHLIRAAFEANPGFANKKIEASGPTSLLVLWAVRSDDPERLRLALGLGLDPNLSHGAVGTALHVAAMNKTANLVEPLLRAGANPDLVDANGETPLHRAIRHGNEVTRQALVAGRANENLRGGAGPTPRQMLLLTLFCDLAREGDVPSMSRMIQEHPPNDELDLVGDVVLNDNAVTAADRTIADRERRRCGPEEPAGSKTNFACSMSRSYVFRRFRGAQNVATALRPG